jgi:hypothetical protein
MKKISKLVIAIFLIFLTGQTAKVSAERVEKTDPIERLSTKLLEENCPEPGDPNLFSVCGSVRQALPQPEVLLDGTTVPNVTQLPVKGVSVYLYECDNTSRTCKRDGLLVHPFSSTSTNEDGMFHLVGRKLENNWLYKYKNQYEYNDTPVDETDEEVNITNQSKKRYLVFKCGDYFQGIHIIPSYTNLTNIVHEVNCPKEYIMGEGENFTYVPPLIQFDFIGGVKLANQMGIEQDGYYPEQTAEHIDNGSGIYEGVKTAVQAYYEKYANEKSQSVPIILEGGDPRFTKPEEGTPKFNALKKTLNLFFWSELSSVVPTEGAYWSKDCRIKYAGTGWEGLCVKDGESYEDYEKRLYKDKDLVTAHLLPNIPPSYSVLYYRPLEIRNEISAYYQDYDDIAKYMGMMFSNCVGEVYKRKWGQTPDPDKKPTYPDCEDLRKCNEALNPNGIINSLTTNGPAQALMDPYALKTLEYEMIPEIPVCMIEGEEKPVLLSQIQRPDQYICEEYDETTEKGMRLCDNGAYWNNYYLTNLGNNNNTLKWGLAGENNDDSYPWNLGGDGSELSDLAFQIEKEGEGVPQAEGVAATAGSGDRAGNNSIKAALEITSAETETGTASTEALTDFIAQPFEDEETKKEISDGIPYYVSSRPVAWGQFSKTNEYEESIITSKSADEGILDNYFFNNEMECEECGNQHYPGSDLSGHVEIEGGREGGSRTPTEGIYLTKPALNRIKNLHQPDFSELLTFWRYDVLDSAISVSTGHSYIDWEMTKVKGAPDNILDIIGSLKDFMNEKDNEKRIKTFADRSPETLAESEREINNEVIAFGFEVNESNFGTLFPCPPGFGVAHTMYPAGLWGKNQKCYPWHSVDQCNTYKCENGGSPTCRVDECIYAEYVESYHCDMEGKMSEHEIDERNKKECTEEVFASCYYDGKATGTPFHSTATCEDKPEGDYIEYSTADYCRVSEAGPNMCDGNILRDAKVNVNSQAINETENLNSLDAYNADEIPDSALNLYKAFRDPYSTDISPMPAAWVSVSSSLSETEPDVSLRKDWPGIGSGVNFLVRAQFGQPQVFATHDLEPMYVHCKNDVLGSKGEWDDEKICNFETLPNPEVLEIKTLQKYYDDMETHPCDLGTSPTCEELVLGTLESGEPLKFSKTFRLILNLAGNKFGVEPAAILAYMHRTGADKEYSYYWSEEGEDDLKKVMLPWYGAFDFCDDLETVAQPPYEWKLVWFSEKLLSNAPGRSSPSNALKELAPGREKTASRCNFLDSTYTLASSIAENFVKYKIVGGEKVFQESITCDKQNWNDEEIGNIMREALGIQYNQVPPELYEKMKKAESYDEANPANEFSAQEYTEIWNACKD